MLRTTNEVLEAQRSMRENDSRKYVSGEREGLGANGCARLRWRRLIRGRGARIASLATYR